MLFLILPPVDSLSVVKRELESLRNIKGCKDAALGGMLLQREEAPTYGVEMKAEVSHVRNGLQRRSIFALAASIRYS
jgi:hypothetical protein